MGRATMSKDYYAILGVPRNADAKALKTAYRELSKKYHPDLNPDDPAAEDKFKEVSEAYAVLSDDQKRARYDRFGDADGGGAAGVNPFDLFENLFGDFFGLGGMGQGGRRRSRAEDLLTQLTLDLETAARGGTRTVTVEDLQDCGGCSGSGAAAGTQAETCVTCGGQGRVQQMTRTILGSMATVITCPACGGQGRTIRHRCPDCRGQGLIRGRRQVEVNLPAGIFDSARLRLRGQGLPSEPGGVRGDLFVDVRVSAHPVFERDGLEVISEVPVSFVCAALGGKIRVPTLEGEREIKINPGIQSGENVRLKGLGIPDLNTTRRGDHIVVLNVQVPTRLSPEQKDLLRQFDEATDEKQREPHKSLWDRIKQGLGQV